MPFRPNAEISKRIGNGKLKSALFKNRQKLESINRATLEARNEIGKLTKRDLLMLGIGLYIGEGSKTNGTIRIVNSKIPLNHFGKTQVDRRRGKKISKRGILPYGTAHLTIKSNGNPFFGKFLFRKIIAWIDSQ